MKKIAIGQAGGPTSVINSTLVGFVKKAMTRYKLTFILNGYEGLVKGKMLKGSDKVIKQVISYRNIPGACLGSGRYPMTQEEIHHVVRSLKNDGIDVLVFIGGDGTMRALNKIKQEALRQGSNLQIIGLPKTVDNDINYTDHSPGFGSAAKYIAMSTKEQSYDLFAMRNFEQVRIIETMGRNAGWLAAASGYLKKEEKEGPHYIILPEQAINKNKLINGVEHAISNYGYAMVVVSEGLKWNGKNQISKDVLHNRAVLGGVSYELEHFIAEQLKVQVRAEKLGMSQRGCSAHVSSVDQKEAYLVGATGAEWLEQELSGVMVAIQREDTDHYYVSLKPVLLEKIALSKEKLMPSHFINDLSLYYKWLSPIIGKIEVKYPCIIK